MIRRIKNRAYDDERAVTIFRLECGHVVETRMEGVQRARCGECARHRAQDLLRGRYGAHFRALVDNACAGGSLAAQEAIPCD